MNRIPLIFIRHGETDWNREFRYQGQTDVPLNERGRLQAARNGRAVAGILRDLEWQLVSSPLGRSVDTMRIALEAAGQPGRDFATEPALLEANYGDWEAMTLEEIDYQRSSEARAREADKWGYAPPNGESYAMLAERVGSWFATLHGPTFVVAHGGTLRALLYLLAGLPSQDAPHLSVPQDRAILFTEANVLTI